VLLDEPSTGVDPAARRMMWNVIADISTKRRECSVMLTTHNMEEAEALCSRIGIMVGGQLRCLGSNQHLKARFGEGYQLEARVRNPEPQATLKAAEDWKLPPSVTGESLVSICEQLGSPARAALVRPGCEEGHAVFEALVREGQLPAHLFAEWWMLEDRAQGLSAFLQRHFPGAKAIERHDRTFRFSLPGGAALAEVFQRLEASREELELEEYGICQTSLEQIFNSLAAKQREEAGTEQQQQGLQRNTSP